MRVKIRRVTNHAMVRSARCLSEVPFGTSRFWAICCGKLEFRIKTIRSKGPLEIIDLSPSCLLIFSPWENEARPQTPSVNTLSKPIATCKPSMRRYAATCLRVANTVKLGGTQIASSGSTGDGVWSEPKTNAKAARVNLLRPSSKAIMRSAAEPIGSNVSAESAVPFNMGDS